MSRWAKGVAPATVAMMVLSVVAGCTQDPVEEAPTREAPFRLEPAFDGASGLVGLAAVPNASAMLAVEQGGRVLVWEGGSTLRNAPVLDISARVRNNGEQGLLGAAVSPRLAQHGFLYVHYSDLAGHTVVSRFPLDVPAMTADPDAEEILLQVSQPYPNHNGGQLLFGPDGLLYLGLGDGGLAGDPDDNAQDPSTLLGSILRLGVDDGAGYRVPRTNPFFDGGGAGEVYVHGLRNPWRFTFDRERGDLWIGDVGQDRVEEVTRLPAGSQAGANLGWPWYEGSLRFRTSGNPPDGLVMPVAEYPSEDTASVVGGYVYRGPSIPDLQGHFLFADFYTGEIHMLAPDGQAWRHTRVLDTDLNISSFAEDSDGELFVLHHGGSAWRLVPA